MILSCFKITSTHWAESLEHQVTAWDFASVSETHLRGALLAQEELSALPPSGVLQKAAQRILRTAMSPSSACALPPHLPDSNADSTGLSSEEAGERARHRHGRDPRQPESSRGRGRPSCPLASSCTNRRKRTFGPEHVDPKTWPAVVQVNRDKHPLRLK